MWFILCRFWFTYGKGLKASIFGDLWRFCFLHGFSNLLITITYKGQHTISKLRSLLCCSISRIFKANNSRVYKVSIYIMLQKMVWALLSCSVPCYKVNIVVWLLSWWFCNTLLEWICWFLMVCTCGYHHGRGNGCSFARTEMICLMRTASRFPTISMLL